MSTIIVEKLSELTGFKVSMLRPYLQGYRFTKFEKPIRINNHVRVGYEFNKEFIDEFTKYIWIKKRVDIKSKLLDYQKTKK